jgi:hypothetical protein
MGSEANPNAANAPAAAGGSQQVANVYGRGLSKGQVLEQLQGLNSRKNEFGHAANNAVVFEEQNRINWSLNDVAYGLQQLEINGDATTLSVLRN